MLLTKEIVHKAWGHEEIWVSTDLYCSKFLHFNDGGEFSMHFHKDKTETWYVVDGLFAVKTINTKDASTKITTLKAGSVWHNDPLMIHQVKCFDAGKILEVSTKDTLEDNYRVLPGDSQK